MASPTTITATRLSPRAAAGLALSTFLLGGALAAAAVVGIADDESRPAPEPVTSPVQSADAAERWSSPRSAPVAVTGSPDALERRLASEQAQRVATCRGGSADAVERCMSAG